MENPDEKAKVQDWEALVDRYLETKGNNMSEYCRQNNLNYDHFRTYKLRLEAKRARKARGGFARVEAAPPAPVKAVAQLPDPEWFARFVRGLLDGK